jgi:hypothetical protein
MRESRAFVLDLLGFSIIQVHIIHVVLTSKFASTPSFAQR